MAEPSNSVPGQLLRHIHLVSSNPYPKLPQVHLDIAVEYLIQAPKIVREVAPMNWTYLDCPPDGEVMLVWQPSQLGGQVASDGFIYADAEAAFSSEVRGYTVEMYIHRSGYRPNFESVATHCRRRFRLTPLQNPDPSLPPPDQSLWIWHYSQTEPQNRFPAHQIRMNDQVRQALHERSILQKHGQLVRKEFMLRDSANWPTINLPGTPNPSYPQQVSGYPGDVISHINRSQQAAYMQQQQQQQANPTRHGVGPSPAKRPRHGGPGHAHGSTTAIPAPVVAQDTTYDEEEGTSGGDFMDFLTPRDISLHRYTQHHEWLEEILNSPYDTSQIIPGQLGLGRKGELESLTRDFFDAPIEATQKETFPKAKGESPVEDSATPRVGRLESGKAEDFTKRATEKIAEINTEMEKLKRQHARRMAKLGKGRAFKEAEQNLRVSTLEMINGEATKGNGVQQHRIDELARGLEAQVGKSIMPVKDVVCIDKGGLEEKSQAKDAKDQDYDMVDTFGNLGGATAPATTYPESRSPGLATPMESGEDRSNVVPSNAPIAETLNQGDVSMDEVQNISEPKDSTADDWVMVNKENNSTAEGEDMPEIESFGDDIAMPTGTSIPNPNDNATGDNVPDFEQGAGEDAAEDFDANDFGEGIDFGDLDTAGEELSGYTPGMENAGLDDRGVLTNEGAFGESFQVMDKAAGQEDKTSGA